VTNCLRRDGSLTVEPWYDMAAEVSLSIPSDCFPIVYPRTFVFFCDLTKKDRHGIIGEWSRSGDNIAFRI
jgi:hypothetical protein